MWLQSQLSLDDPLIEDQNLYTPTKSRTSRNLQKFRDIRYGDRSHVSASLFEDEVTVGTLTCGNQALGAASTSDIDDKFRSKSSNGILGLGFPLDGADEAASVDLSNIVLALHASNKVKYASLSIIGPRNDPKTAADIDKNKIMQPRGFFVIGSVDPKFYTGTISWCPQLMPDRWIVDLDQVIINDVVVAEKQRVLIDTGTPYIVASPRNYERVIGSIQGGRKYPAKKDLFFTYPETSLSKVSFVLGGRTFKMFPQDFGLGGIKLYPKSSTSGTDKATNPVQDKGVARIVSSIMRLESWPFDDDMWIIGGIFLDNIVTIFDFGARQVGFADISEEDLEKEPTVSA